MLTHHYDIVRSMFSRFLQNRVQRKGDALIFPLADLVIFQKLEFADISEVVD